MHGQRVVLPPEYRQDSCNLITYRIRVYDFNVHPKRIDDPCPTEFRQDYAVVSKESVIEGEEVFLRDVVSRLPYSQASKDGRYNYSGFLIDEERLVGMKVRTCAFYYRLGMICVLITYSVAFHGCFGWRLK